MRLFPRKKWDVSIIDLFLNCPKNSTHQHHKMILCVQKICKNSHKNIIHQKFVASGACWERLRVHRPRYGDCNAELPNCWKNPKNNSQASAAPTCKCQKLKNSGLPMLHSENWKTHVLYISLHNISSRPPPEHPSADQ